MSVRARTLEHVGEWLVEITAATLEGVFGELARVIARTAPLHRAAAAEGWESISLEAPDAATLLVDWANEILGRSEAHDMAYSDIRDLTIRTCPGGVALHARVRGHPVAPWSSPLKAATYHGLSLGQVNGQWRATVLLDV